MKAHQSSASFIVILLVMSVFNLPLNVLAAHQDETAALRGNTVVGQEERILGKGGNGGGGGGGGGQNKNNESITPAPTNASTPAPTNASTPAPTNASTPRPTQGYPVVPSDSCGTRPPVTTPSPSPTPPPPTPPTEPKCFNPGPGECHSKNNPCCDGFECSGGKTKTCVEVRRNLRVEQAKSFPFQTSVADESHRKLDQCTASTDSCNEFDNPILCEVNGDIPSNAKDLPSIICNYADDAQYLAGVDPCDSNSNFCCADGNGGYYSPASCWNAEWQCCPKGYTKNLYGNSCIPMNCCDGDADHITLYCPNNCQ